MSPSRGGSRPALCGLAEAYQGCLPGRPFTGPRTSRAGTRPSADSRAIAAGAAEAGGLQETSPLPSVLKTQPSSPPEPPRLFGHAPLMHGSHPHATCPNRIAWKLSRSGIPVAHQPVARPRGFRFTPPPLPPWPWVSDVEAETDGWSRATSARQSPLKTGTCSLRRTYRLAVETPQMSRAVRSRFPLGSVAGPLVARQPSW